MSHKLAAKPYHWLAEYYDEFFAPARVPIDAARRKILAPVLRDVRTACDLACGTGATAMELAREGIAMTAVDISPRMCRLSRAKARAAGVRLRVIRADMRTFRLNEPVDLITCEGDALNHIPRRTDLARVARAVARALRPGGYFYFDVNNSRGFEVYWTGTVCLEKPGVMLVMRNGHNRQANRAWSDIDWFVRNGRNWRRRHERVEEVCWSAGEITRTFQAAGFDDACGWDAAPFWAAGEDKASPVNRGCRTLYLARKRRA